MKVDSTYEISAPRENIYAALIDPEVLKRCIPGCESLEKTGENIYAATLKAGIGAIKGKFTGDVRLRRHAATRTLPHRRAGQRRNGFR